MNGIQEVSGSIPLGSTNKIKCLAFQHPRAHPVGLPRGNPRKSAMRAFRLILLGSGPTWICRLAGGGLQCRRRDTSLKKFSRSYGRSTFGYRKTEPGRRRSLDWSARSRTTAGGRSPSGAHSPQPLHASKLSLSQARGARLPLLLEHCAVGTRIARPSA